MEDEGAAPGERPDRERLDFAGLTEQDANEVRNAIARGENFHGYIPAESLGFIIRNYRILAPMGVLEAAWLDAYVHSSHFSERGLSVVKSVFDACNRERLCMLKPLGQALTFEKEGRLTLFRGGAQDRRTAWACRGRHRSIKRSGTQHITLNTMILRIQRSMSRPCLWRRFTAAWTIMIMISSCILAMLGVWTCRSRNSASRPR
jgi:hypothetical protein